jgi:pyruvate formate lyase activating enzyme
VCVEACPANAQELLGRHSSVEELFQEVMKDAAFFDKSEGGVTVSGGEPLLQAEFVAAFLGKLRDQGVHAAIDTCGMVPTRNLKQVLPMADLILFDIKEICTEKHKELTGSGNETILKNILLVREYIQEQTPEMQLWIRTPLIPQATATAENLTGIGKFAAENLDGVLARWELCSFNNLCKDKYHRLGMDWAYSDIPLFSFEELLEFKEIARRSGIAPEKVFLTGLTRVAD